MSEFATNLQLFAPAKTFLLGEYFATETHDEALLITTKPYFELRLTPAKTFTLKNITKTSPAGLFIHDHLAKCKPVTMEFFDPYAKKGLQGGLGASTAQFLLAYAFINPTYTPKQIFNNYLHYAYNGIGLLPSATDLLAQQHLGITHVNKQPLQTHRLAWQFSDLAYHLLHTRHKLATHSHLQTLNKVNTQSLQIIFQQGNIAFNQADSDKFCQAINAYQQALTDLQLMALHTQTLVQQLRQHPEIFASKGCGAFGYDVILCLTKKNQTPFIKKLCKTLNLAYIVGN